MKQRYMCPYCFKLYKLKEAKKMAFHCCDTLVGIDKDIAEDIALMNKKGYQTEYCCAGHLIECDDGKFDHSALYVALYPIRRCGVYWLLRHIPPGFSIDIATDNKTTVFTHNPYRVTIYGQFPKFESLIDIDYRERGNEITKKNYLESQKTKRESSVLIRLEELMVGELTSKKMNKF